MKKQIETLGDLGQLEFPRPFFSIVISCYNSRKTIRKLLESLCQQNLEYKDLEVIISDDCSTEPYDDIVQEYLNELLIKEVKTEYNCCPGNTRERGAQEATGQWLCFSDHDDIFIDESLGELKRRIDEGEIQEQYCIYTSFYELREDLITINKQVPASDSGGWTHGKFYNLDNFWKEYNLHYKKDLKSHEDIYLTCCVNTILDKLHLKGVNALTELDDLYTYGWVCNHESLSHRKYDDYNFLEKHFSDYVESTGYCYLDMYYNNIIPYSRAKQYLLDSIVLYYFYYQSFYYENPNKPISKNYEILHEFILTVKQQMDINNNAIWQFAADNQSFAFNRGWEKTNIGTGGIVPSQTFAEWLKYICPDKDPIHESIYYIKK